ncbi:glycoside hydrolase family 11 protein [Amniculicola lignicola CBS 123094]|uniref:Endo-1,4-beta-xylanase n=1 Tax=Amniculicola lignicola CBS 123094 TaxID=1392246 RepID=A0A6A5W9B3_9PLEO|nr:glycoside hydrolase family 11 protein [Amniculicola lignicola CBS 123094]
MVSFTTIVTTALALIPGAITAPSGLVGYNIHSNSLETRQTPWQWWTEGQGQFSCQQQGGGKYSCTWSGKAGGGMVAGTGWGAGRKTVKYAGQYNAKGPGYLSLYGWTRNPLIEYYIVEGWDVLAPGEPWTLRGNFTSEGGNYLFYTAQRVNKPSIDGTRTFTQYFSVRVDAERRIGEVSGSINTANHFDAWSKFGYKIGGFAGSMFMVTEAFANGTKLPTGTSTITVS